MVNEKNITSLLLNYLSCDYIEYIIFSYGFHGLRKQIFDKVITNISIFPYEFLPVRYSSVVKRGSTGLFAVLLFQYNRWKYNGCRKWRSTCTID